MKTFTILKQDFRNGTTKEITGTLEEFINDFSYTLECGKCYEHEKGNKKINMNPKTIKSFITNVNNALRNAAANGCPRFYFELA